MATIFSTKSSVQLLQKVYSHLGKNIRTNYCKNFLCTNKHKYKITLYITPSAVYLLCHVSVESLFHPYSNTTFSLYESYSALHTSWKDNHIWSLGLSTKIPYFNSNTKSIERFSFFRNASTRLWHPTHTIILFFYYMSRPEPLSFIHIYISVCPNILFQLPTNKMHHNAQIHLSFIPLLSI